MSFDLAIKVLAVFAAVATLDFVWAKYTYAMTAKKPALAGAYAGGIICLSGSAAIGYTSDPLLLLPAVAGAFVGIFFAVRQSARVSGIALGADPL